MFQEFAHSGTGVLFCTVRIILNSRGSVSVSVIGGCGFFSPDNLPRGQPRRERGHLLVWLAPRPFCFVTRLGHR